MIYFIVNETSQTGKTVTVWQEVEKRVKQSGLRYQVFKTEYAGHASKLALEISQADDDDICLIAVGGDGTINEIINGIKDFEKLRFGIIPCGSGNDFRRGLSLPKTVIESWEKIRERIEKGASEYTAIDLGLVEWNHGCDKRIYGISAGVGLDAMVCKKALTSKLKVFLNKMHLGKLTYGILTVISLFTMETTKATLHFITEEYDRTVHTKKLIFAAAMNLYNEGGGVPMAPKGNPFDGLLSTCYAHGIPKWLTFCCFPLLLAAKHEKLHGFGVTNSKQVQIKSEKPMVLHADGEYLGDVNEVTFESLPQKLKVLM